MKADRHKWNCGTGGRASLFCGLVLMTAAALAGCSTLSASKKSEESARHRRSLEIELKKTQAKLDELRERNLVLERRHRQLMRESSGLESPQVPVPFAPQAGGVRANESLVERELHAPKVELVSKPAPTPVERHEPTIKNVGSAETGEHFLYSKVLETYRRRNAGEMQKSMHLLLKTYPDSVFADNALFLSGLLALETGDLGRAKSYMKRVIGEYPGGNKAVSAMFALAVIEKRNKNYNDARQLLEKVRAQYPGSPEAARVGLELKILKLSPNAGNVAGNRQES